MQKQRRSFDHVKKELRSKDLKYMMLFPAHLKVIAEGKPWFFVTPDEAWVWLEGWRTAGKRRDRGPRQSPEQSNERRDLPTGRGPGSPLQGLKSLAEGGDTPSG